jgi:hypothetical protein
MCHCINYVDRSYRSALAAMLFNPNVCRTSGNLPQHTENGSSPSETDLANEKTVLASVFKNANKCQALKASCKKGK